MIVFYCTPTTTVRHDTYTHPSSRYVHGGYLLRRRRRRRRRFVCPFPTRLLFRVTVVFMCVARPHATTPLRPNNTNQRDTSDEMEMEMELAW